MADLDRDYQIKVLQAQVQALTQALNETRDKLGLPAIQVPKAAR